MSLKQEDFKPLRVTQDGSDVSIKILKRDWRYVDGMWIKAIQGVPNCEIFGGINNNHILGANYWIHLF